MEEALQRKDYDDKCDNICLTSVTRAKPKEKRAFPA